ncbi:hypothetical protein D3C73_923780 [compost metagenome]
MVVGAVLQVLAHVTGGNASHATGQHVLGELHFALDGFGQHVVDILLHLVVEQIRLFLADHVHALEGEFHVRAFVAEHPVGARGQAVEQAARTEVVHVGEGGEEEQAFDARSEADLVEQELTALFAGLDALQVLDRIDPLEAEIGLLLDRVDVLHRGEGFDALVRIRQVVVQQGQVELHVQRFFIQLARQVHARFGRVQVLVQVQHQVVGHDRIAGGEERDKTMDQVTLARRHLAVQVADVDLEVDLFHRPGVLDRIPVHVIELRVAHRAQGQFKTGIEQHLLGLVGHGCFLEFLGERPGMARRYRGCLSAAEHGSALQV